MVPYNIEFFYYVLKKSFLSLSGEERTKPFFSLIFACNQKQNKKSSSSIDGRARGILLLGLPKVLLFMRENCCPRTKDKSQTNSNLRNVHVYSF